MTSRIVALVEYVTADLGAGLTCMYEQTFHECDGSDAADLLNRIIAAKGRPGSPTPAQVLDDFLAGPTATRVRLDDPPPYALAPAPSDPGAMVGVAVVRPEDIPRGAALLVVTRDRLNRASGGRRACAMITRSSSRSVEI